MNKALAVALARVDIAQQRISALEFAIRGITDRHYRQNAREEYSAIHCALYADLNDAYRDLFMWGNLNTDPRAGKEARYAAYKYFFARDMSIARHFDVSNEYSGHYSKEDEAYFKQRLLEEKKKFGVQDKLAGNINVADLIYDEPEDDEEAPEPDLVPDE